MRELAGTPASACPMVSSVFCRAVTAVLLAALLLSVGAPVRADPIAAVVSDEQLNDIEQRTFQYFWDTADPRTGLIPDRYPTKTFASIAAVGFGLSAIVIGAERHYISREQARDRTLATLRLFANAKQGPQVNRVAGYHGFFYHFLDESGERFAGTELSTIDTALLLSGMLSSESYFDRKDAGEREIRALVERIYSAVDWKWMQKEDHAISHGWSPENGFIPYNWKGYSEGMLLYILALGAPRGALGPQAWKAWTSTYDQFWGQWRDEPFISFAPLFGHQYPQAWIDFRGIRDEFMRGKDLDYFENSRRATYAQRQYASENPQKWRDYSDTVWGVTACDGPGDMVLDYAGEQRRFFAYAGRGAAGPHAYDDGTIAPTAAISSIAFAPEIALPAIQTLQERYGKHIYGQYGFLDSFNPSFRYDVRVKKGTVIADAGWVDDDYIGIDQGPIVMMIENYRSGLIWKLMRSNPHIVRGLKRAGFTGGWLRAAAADRH